MTGETFSQLANNFYTSKGLFADVNTINLNAELLNYTIQNEGKLKSHKVAFVFICLNPLYWQYAHEMVQGAKQFFLPGHKTDFFFWTDIPEAKEDINSKVKEAFVGRGLNLEDPSISNGVNHITETTHALRSTPGINIIPTEAVDWPYPTLLRYNLFLGEEEKLKEYDYIYYCDIDMQFVGIVGDEILGGITGAQHPMYALRKEYWPPYEPNENSASYIKRPGKVIVQDNKPRFMPLYYAGGFQGGESAKFIKAMKECKDLIESDMNKNYIPIWNDETAWNKYLSENPPDVVLSPSYIYPDSLIEEYYVKLWGCNYAPRLKTLTKWFSTSKEGGKAVNDMLK